MDTFERRAGARPAVRVSEPPTTSMDAMDLVVAGFAIVAAVLMSFLR